jgi:tetratricopeptide (TPR) repeat protein
MKRNVRSIAVWTFLLVLGLAAAGRIFAQDRQGRPPEYQELVAATRIQDAAARLKEFERIKAAYPQSRFMSSIDMYILSAKVELAGILDEILAIQKDFLAGVKGPMRLQGQMIAADEILTHPKLGTFDKAAVLAAVLGYRDAAVKIAEDPSAFEGVPPARRESFKSYVVTGFSLLVAQARLNAGDTAEAMAALDGYKKEGGMTDGPYFYTLGGVLEKMGKTEEAYKAFLSAAAEEYEDSVERARTLYTKLNGKADGFEAALEAKLKALPYHPEPFTAPAGWKGKAVLAELFTGSECPPCVGADMGFDGLIETYPTKYLAVLEYHLPIPRPDPMMNPATKARQEYYDVNSTPTVVIDGDKKMIGGGSRGMAEGKYKEYKAEIDARLGAEPSVALKVQAVRAGDTINVAYDFDKAVPGAEYDIALVQGEEGYKGSNGLLFHKLVVRDIVAVDPVAAKKASFDLTASELATDQYLTNFENTSTRFQGFKFAERHNKIDRTNLEVVFFVQDKASKKVLNAVVAAVK